MLFMKNHDKWFNHILSIPFIYGVFIGFIIFHLVLEIYQSICFPLYGIKKNKRKDYIIVDRHKLSYLRLKDKLNCVYCGYASGLANYAAKIIADTEEYWCAIKHKDKEYPYQKNFAKYGDEEDLKKKYFD